jgi:cation-transporting ATPase F
VVTVIVTVDVFYLLNCGSLLRSPFEMGVFGNRWVFLGIAAMALAQALFAHAPAMNRFFGTAPIDGAAWLYAIGIGVVAYLVVEVEKRLRLRREEGLVPPRTPLPGSPLPGA